MNLSLLGAPIVRNGGKHLFLHDDGKAFRTQVTSYNCRYTLSQQAFKIGLMHNRRSGFRHSTTNSIIGLQMRATSSLGSVLDPRQHLALG